jgi:hypothetical protein
MNGDASLKDMKQRGNLSKKKKTPENMAHTLALGIIHRPAPMHTQTRQRARTHTRLHETHS